MNEPYLLKGCELHMHVVGAFYADDALALGRAVDRDVNWHANRFLEIYQARFGVRPDPISVFDDAVRNGAASFARLKRLHPYTVNPSIKRLLRNLGTGGEVVFLCSTSHMFKLRISSFFDFATST